MLRLSSLIFDRSSASTLLHSRHRNATSCFLFIAFLSLAVFGQVADKSAATHQAQTPASQHQTEASGCSRDLREDSKAGVLITDATFDSLTSVGSNELSTIKGRLEGSCIDENDDTIREVIAAAFEDQGFARASVENITLKPSDALTVPKPVALKADVTEGPRFRLGAITFVGNHAFGAAKLRSVFPYKTGDLFQRSKIASGLERIRKLYLPRGYRDLTYIPDLEFSEAGTASLMIQIMEGAQYHMGELKVYAKKDIADRLATEWRLREGAVFNLNYPETFLKKSQSIPEGFGRQNIRLVRNCPDATIAVLVIVDQTDPSLQTLPHEVRCEKSNNESHQLEPAA
jgi:hypothetical protein